MNADIRKPAKGSPAVDKGRRKTRIRLAQP